MLYLIKSSLEANKKINILMLMTFILVTFYKLEAGLVAALYVIIKIGKSTSDYNYFYEMKNMVRTFPSSKNLYAKYCIISNNIIGLFVLLLWIVIGIYKNDYSIQQLIYYSLIIYIPSSFFNFMYDISEIRNRVLYIENIRKISFIILAFVFISISRIPRLYENIGNIVFLYSNIKLTSIIILSILLNVLFYITLKSHINKYYYGKDK